MGAARQLCLKKWSCCREQLTVCAKAEAYQLQSISLPAGKGCRPPLLMGTHRVASIESQQLAQQPPRAGSLHQLPSAGTSGKAGVGEAGSKIAR